MLSYSFKDLESYKETFFKVEKGVVTMYVLFNETVKYKDIISGLPYFLHTLGIWGYTDKAIYLTFHENPD